MKTLPTETTCEICRRDAGAAYMSDLRCDAEGFGAVLCPACADGMATLTFDAFSKLAQVRPFCSAALFFASDPLDGTWVHTLAGALTDAQARRFAPALRRSRLQFREIRDVDGGLGFKLWLSASEPLTPAAPPERAAPANPETTFALPDGDDAGMIWDRCNASGGDDQFEMGAVSARQLVVRRTSAGHDHWFFTVDGEAFDCQPEDWFPVSGVMTPIMRRVERAFGHEFPLRLRAPA